MGLLVPAVIGLFSLASGIFFTYLAYQFYNGKLPIRGGDHLGPAALRRYGKLYCGVYASAAVIMALIVVLFLLDALSLL